MDFARVIEVGPRDGLQNEKVFIPTAQKLMFIQALSGAGLKEIEITSFVSPKWVPQLADSAEIFSSLTEVTDFSALVPNLERLDHALAVGAERIAFFTAASESFTRRNINLSIDESLRRFTEMVEIFRAKKPNGWIRAYISTVFKCPFEGRIEPSKVMRVLNRLLEIGVDEISLGDTIGVASPREVKALGAGVQTVIASRPEQIAWHFHDTWGTGIANVSAALEMGFRNFDSSAGGLGGCPFAPGAGGNLATEDLVYLLECEGLATGVDLGRLSQASLPIFEALGRDLSSKVQVATLAANGSSRKQVDSRP